jgi:hypothetical protein
VGYFGEMMSTNADINDAVRPLLNLSRGMIRRSGKLEYDLVSSLERDPLLKERLRRLRTVPGVGDHGAHLGSRDRRLHTLQFQPAGDQLLRLVC